MYNIHHNCALQIPTLYTNPNILALYIVDDFGNLVSGNSQFFELSWAHHGNNFWSVDDIISPFAFNV